MPVVSNTSPILNLAIIDRLTLLRDQFGLVLIPPAVLRELRTDEDLPGTNCISEAIDDGWIRIVEIEDLALVKLLQRELDYGESEAIALALQIKAERILMDEREGRKLAKSLGLTTTGVLGILLRARRSQKITSMKAVMDELKTRAGFRISASLYDELLRQEETL